MDLEELNVYRLSMEIGDKVWNIVKEWDKFTKDTIGKQLVRAADSVAANISEGFGRFFYKDSKLFYYYSRGSLYETKTFLNKAYNRSLIGKEEYEKLVKDVQIISIKLNNYIKSIGKISGNSEVSEDSVEYNDPSNSKIELEDL